MILKLRAFISRGIKTSLSAPRWFSSKTMDRNERMVWIDMEMTGLDVKKDQILEVSCLITEGDLTHVDKIERMVIHCPQYILNGMDDWCKKTHGDSGLTKACLESTLTVQEAEARLLELLQEHTEYKKSVLAGNTVHMDKLFLEKYMPKAHDHLHYRIVDVSTIKELCRKWYPQVYANAPRKQACHRAYEDIIESIEELKYYQKAMFKPSQG